MPLCCVDICCFFLARLTDTCRLWVCSVDTLQEDMLPQDAFPNLLVFTLYLLHVRLPLMLNVAQFARNLFATCKQSTWIDNHLWARPHKVIWFCCIYITGSILANNSVQL